MEAGEDGNNTHPRHQPKPKGMRRNEMNNTDTPRATTNTNFNQATNDVIILYNDDGTKVIMVLENGRWLQARTESDRCKGGNSYEK